LENELNYQKTRNDELFRKYEELKVILHNKKGFRNPLDFEFSTRT